MAFLVIAGVYILALIGARWSFWYFSEQHRTARAYWKIVRANISFWADMLALEAELEKRGIDRDHDSG